MAFSGCRISIQCSVPKPTGCANGLLRRVNQWVPMLRMHAPSACKGVSHGSTPAIQGSWCAGFWLGQWEAFKNADHGSSRQSPPQPANPVPGCFLGGFHGGTSSGARLVPSVLAPQQSRLQRKHFRGGRPFLQPSERGHPPPSQRWHTQKPHPFSSRGLARSTQESSVFPSFPSHDRPGIPTPPDTTQDGTGTRASLAVLSLPEVPNAV